MTVKKELKGIDSLKARLGKAVKGMHVQRMSDSDIAGVRHYFPTPSYDLNRIISGSLFKGIPSRSYTMIVGPEASFKSSFMCLCAIQAQKEGYTPVVIDTEGAWDGDFVRRWGLDPENILYIYTPWIDEILVTLSHLVVDKDQKLCIIIDSIGGLEKLKLIKDGVGKDGVKADQGLLQKEIKRMLKIVLNICKGQDSIALSSGHFYGNPNSYGNADEIGGGKFARLAPDTIISLKKFTLYENPSAKGAARGKVLGQDIKACALKNRFYPPFQEATIEISYQNGINCVAGILDIALDADIIECAGSWFTLPDGQKVQGKEKVKEALKEDPKAMSSFLKAVEKYVSTSGYSTKNDAVEEAIKILEAQDADDEKKKKKEK